MGINLNNFLNYKNKDQKMGDFQDLDHLDGVSISTGFPIVPNASAIKNPDKSSLFILLKSVIM